MPRAPRKQGEVKEFRDLILDTALQLVVEKGYNSLSMRSIASRLGITATTIYNYLSSKDELNLLIRMRGFRMLYERLKRGYGKGPDFDGRIGGMVHGYVEFGVGFPAYYDLMFNLSTPKYLDYVGTEMESSAWKEKETALRCFDIFARIIREYSDEHGQSMDDDFIVFATAKVWSDLHGIVSLYNSRVLHEINENGRLLLDRRVDDIILSVLNLCKLPAKAARKRKNKR